METPAPVSEEIPLRGASGFSEQLRFTFVLKLRHEFCLEVSKEFKLRIEEICTVYKIVYSDVTEKPETHLSY